MEIFVLIVLIIALIIGLGIFFFARLIYLHYFKNKNIMETNKTKFTRSFTFKAITIALLTMLLLIPSAMIQDMIKERQERSHEAVRKINAKWSHAQTLCAPLLLIPYTTTAFDKENKLYKEEHTLYITPKNLKINASLTPEERHYGIYKAILYKSRLHFEGDFSELDKLKIDNSELHFDKAQIAIGITDLRGIAENPEFNIGNKKFKPSVGIVKLFSVPEETKSEPIDKFGMRHIRTGDKDFSGKTLIINLEEINLNLGFHFNCNMKLNGSGAISFIPVGQNTNVKIDGQWKSPSFIGNFSPESTLDQSQFSANWNILSFNREIPEMWTDKNIPDWENSSFGVNLIETVNHYQQNMRSVKYALMFIALTFIVFFFIEIFTQKPIHFFQYALVGVSLILFYSLLLSLSEQIGFGWAYLVASIATVSMITIYFHSLIRQKTATSILISILTVLYAFLYIILQIEDFALLLGSIFLFIMLGVIMFLSNKIKHPIK